MKLKQDGMIAKLAFGVNGQRKDISLCELVEAIGLRLFILVFGGALIVFVSLIIFGIKIIGSIPAFCIGYQPDFSWFIPDDERHGKETKLFIPYVENGHWIAGVRVWLSNAYVSMLVLAVLATFSLMIAVPVGHMLEARGYVILTTESIFRDVVVRIGIGFVTIGILSIIGYALYALTKLKNTEVGQVVRAWFMAKKDKVCPIVTFE